jgi:tRNA 2-thiouridine synthesizing protein A
MADVARTLDVTGMACPMPVVKTKLAMNELESGQVLEVISTDRGSLTDIPAWSEATGNRLIAAEARDATFLFLIEKG